MDLNHKILGEGMPMIILHGLFGTLDNWMTIAKLFARDYQVFLVDLRNHGHSPHVKGMSLEDMAEDIRIFLEKQWVYADAVIIGHSMGGKVAMKSATLFPDLFSKLVVVDIGPKAYPQGGHDDIFKAMMSLDVDRTTSRNEAEEHLMQYIPEDSTRQFIMKNLSRNKEGGFSWKMNLKEIHEQYPEILKEIDTGSPFEKPALFVRGGKSDYILDEDIPRIKQLFPNAQVSEIAGAGHWVHADAPNELYKMVDEFLDKN